GEGSSAAPPSTTGLPSSGEMLPGPAGSSAVTSSSFLAARHDRIEPVLGRVGDDDRPEAVAGDVGDDGELLRPALDPAGPDLDRRGRERAVAVAEEDVDERRSVGLAGERHDVGLPVVVHVGEDDTDDVLVNGSELPVAERAVALAEVDGDVV